MSSFVERVMAETQSQLGLKDLTTEYETPSIKKEEEDGATSSSKATNPYASMTNSGMRKRKEREAVERQSPYAPNPPKARLKKAVAPGKLLDTRTMQTYSRANVQALKYVSTLLKRIEEALDTGAGLNRLFNSLRKALHEAEFTNNLCGQLVTDSKLLEPRGLPAIYGSDTFPVDIVDDATVLHHRWLKGQYDPHLLHGIELKNHALADGKVYKSRSLEKGYQFKASANNLGANGLINGQWWPLQVCAMRDGAHGEMEAGISGEKGKGAYSIVVGSSGYADIDNGDDIQYCGTLGTMDQPSGNTNLMLEAHRLRNEVRVIRSGATGSKKTVYQPLKGLRYDGLYQITADELLDEATAMHRFTLRRVAGQHPIRYTGVEVRPTPEEIRAYESIREGLGYKS